ncbi:MAG TPA: amidohydrolase family protein [Magnetospirillaceae bacterium]|jgi:imidazolonepropionase-like amidohydrolase
MANVLFTNVRIIDGTGAQPYAGDVLVQGNRISRIARGSNRQSVAGVQVIDAAGATLMPGMCEAHLHLAWSNAPTLDSIQLMPLEEHMLLTAANAKLYLDHGFTSGCGAATAKPRLDVVVRNSINEGLIPGPRYLAASQEITVAGSLGDDTLPHLPFEEFSFGKVVSGPEEMRKAVRTFLKYGVDSIKLNLSGDNFVPHALSRTNWMSDEEVAMGVRETKLRGKRNIVHARSQDSVQQALRHGVELLYHVSYTDEETLDMLEAAKDQIFVVPTFSVLVELTYRGEAYGLPKGSPMQRNMEHELEACAKSMRALHKRGVRIMPGGDYGFAWAKHGENAKDLLHLVEYAGMTPMEALLSTTKLGGQIMMQPDELGQIKEGYLADMLLVDGDPLADLSILQDRNKILAVMKDGNFHREPEMRSTRTRWSLPAA